MGQNQTTTRRTDAFARIPENTRAPNYLKLDNPKAIENRAAFEVPRSNIRIVHVDAEKRSGIVGEHGYVALRMGHNRDDGSSQQSKDAMRDMFGESRARRPSQADLGFSSMSPSMGQDASGGMSVLMRPPPPPGDAKASEEYTEEMVREVKGLRSDIRDWKKEFQKKNGRMPNRTDVAAVPDMQENINRVREIEFLQMQSGASKFMQVREAQSGIGASGFFGGGQSMSMGFDRSLSLQGGANSNHHASSGLLQGSQAASDLPFSGGGGSSGGAATPGAKRGRSGSNLSEDGGAAAPPAMGGFQNLGYTDDRSNSQQESSPMSRTAMLSKTVKKRGTQKFFFPRGEMMKDKIFFDDEGEADFPVVLKDEYEYDMEEEEIHDIAGVQRVRAHKGEEYEDEDPLSTYQPHSAVLDALRIAVGAPIDQFRPAGADDKVDGIDDADQVEALCRFREAALLHAQGDFDKNREDDLVYHHALLSGAAFDADGTDDTLQRVRTAAGPTFNNNGSHENSHDGRLGSAGSDGTGGFGGTFAGAPSIANFNYMDGVDVSDPNAVKKAKTARRKALQKALNDWKETFEAENGRAPEAFELAQDPSIRDVFAEYNTLKKEVKASKKAQEVEDRQSAAKAAADSLGGFAVHPDAARVSYAGVNNDSATPETSPARVHVYESQSPAPEEDSNHLDVSNGATPGGTTPRLQPLGTPRLDELSPPSAHRPLTDAERRELKALNKHVKLWKKSFKDREGRNPNRTDIRAASEITDKYFRLKDLQNMEKGGNHDNSDGEDGGQSKPVNDIDFNYAPLPAGPEGVSPSAALEGEETIDRRDFEADEQLAYKQIMKQMTQEEAPFAAELQALRPTTQDIPTSILSDDDNNARRVKFNAEDGNNTTQDNDGGMSAFQVHKRKKALTKELNSWKVRFKSDNMRDPTTKDIKADPAIAPTYEEWVVLGKLSKKTAEEDEDHQEASPAPSAARDPFESLSPAEKKQKKKDLTKTLNAWKAHFKTQYGREPSAKDITTDPSIAPTYDEYMTLKTGQVSMSPGSRNASEAPEEEVSVQITPRNSISPARRGSTTSAITAAVNAGGSSDRTDAILLDESKMTTSDAEYLAARRNHLSNELKEWKKAFIDRVGRAPTSSDIKNDPSMSIVHEEYELIPSDINSRITNLEHQEAAQMEKEQAIIKTETASKNRKKELTKKLNDWKAQFETDNGRKPKAADIEADPTIAPVYSEYMAMKRGDAPAKEEEAASPAEEPKAAEVAAPEEKDHKKELTKKLNDWKAQFETDNGRKPKAADIEADPTIAPVYSEYMAMKRSDAPAKE